jgi:hypothetical protein
MRVMDADGSNTRDLTQGSDPSWSPSGQRIAFGRGVSGTQTVHVWSVNADGTDEQQLAEGGRPAWSPDGRKIAFIRGSVCTFCSQLALWVMDADGSDQQQLTFPGNHDDLDAEWSPDGGEIAFRRDETVYDPDRDCFPLPTVRKIRRDGAGEVQLSPDGTFPAWSPDGQKIAFVRSFRIWTMNPDGSNRTELPGAHVAAFLDWQPLPVNTPSSHVRPIAASPIQVSLVPAYRECTGAGNRTHGPPFSYPSCAPPQQTSPNLTVRTPGGDNLFKGLARLAMRLGPPGGVDDSDARLRVSVSHVMHASDFSEYTGELRTTARVRVTDKDGGVSSTIQDFPLSFDVPCVSTPDPNLRSTCDIVTGFDAVIPGSSPEGTRAVWALDQVRVYDGGPDEDADTEGDNSLFAVQGVFVP